MTGFCLEVFGNDHNKNMTRMMLYSNEDCDKMDNLVLIINSFPRYTFSKVIDEKTKTLKKTSCNSLKRTIDNNDEVNIKKQKC